MEACENENNDYDDLIDKCNELYKDKMVLIDTIFKLKEKIKVLKDTFMTMNILVQQT